MKAISLWQPWATLVAIGAKRIETRSWPTRYRGLLAIHATKQEPFPNAGFEPAFEALLAHVGIASVAELPRGVIVATCRLVNCVPAMDLAQTVSRQEFAFGDYSPGRFAWVLDDITALETLVPARGMQGLWDATAVLSAAGVTW